MRKVIFKPMLTTFGESFNTNLYNTAYIVNDWSLGLDISVMGMIIPNSQLKYDAELPSSFGNMSITDVAELRDGMLKRNFSGFTSQPTIYGGRSNPIFAAPQNSFPPDSFAKTVAYPEGNSINFMSGLPVVQLVLGLPTRSQIRFRFLTVNVQDQPLTYLSFGLNQNVDRMFEIFGKDESKSLSFNAAYSKLSRDRGIDISSFAAGMNFSNKFDFGLTFYSGLQYEGLSGSIEAKRKISTSDEIINSPYDEIRNGSPVKFDVESFTSFRLTCGLSYQLGPLELHTDAAYASQPVLSFGATIWFFKPDEFKFEFAPIPETQFKPNQLIAHRSFKTREIPIETLPVGITVERKYELSADLKLFGKIQDIEYPLQKIRIEEYLSRQMKPLLPYLFFDDNSAELPAKYIRYNSVEQSKDFNFNLLLGQSTLESYYQLLNIIAYRLKDNPGASIKISGYRSKKGLDAKNKGISKARAEKVKNYFVNVWKIDASRIKVEFADLPKLYSNESTPEGISENRRVELYSDNMEIMKPVDLRDTIRKVTPNIILFKPTTKTETAIAGYDINVLSKFKNMKNFKGKGIVPKLFEWDLQNDPNILKLKNNLTYKMIVKDTINQTFETENKELNVELVTIEQKRQNATKDTIINVYNLILFDFNKSTLDLTNKAITDIIKSEIPENAIVKVTGYTDIIGKEEYNLKLSTARALSTSKALGAKNVTSEGKGEYELLFDNTFPEGRFYCRTVVVEVRIPVN